MFDNFYPAQDFDIRILDAFSGKYISLSSEGYCGVLFNALGSAQLTEALVQLTGQDGVKFQAEYYGVTSWTISGVVRGPDARPSMPSSAAGAWENYSQLVRAWTQYPERLQPRGVIPLYFKRPGRAEQVVFGRPQRIDPDTTHSYAGMITYQAAFRQSDPLFYSAFEHEVSVDVAPVDLGGILLNTDETALLTALRTTNLDTSATDVYNEGDANAPVVITFTGQIFSPVIAYLSSDGTVGWEIRLNADVTAGTTVTIDSRQWQRSVSDQTGASWAGALRGQSLVGMTIPPGYGRIVCSGAPLTGTASCTVTYRDTWSSI